MEKKIEKEERVRIEKEYLNEVINKKNRTFDIGCIIK